MGTHKRKAMTDQPRVWIELEIPAGKTPDDRKADAEYIALRANRMIQRLSPGTPYRFAWSDHKCMWMYGDPMGYRYLNDAGEWFSLEHVGREFSPPELECGMREPQPDPNGD